MGDRIRILAIPDDQSDGIRVQLAFASPNDDETAPCAAASFVVGDEPCRELGVICSPTSATWRSMRLADLGTLADGGKDSISATLSWGDTRLEGAVLVLRPGSTRPIDVPDLLQFRIIAQSDLPLHRLVRVEVERLASPQSLRIDCGAGQVFHLAGDAGAPLVGEWPVSYAKPGSYTIAVDLLDGGGFWVLTMAESPIDVDEPITAPYTNVPAFVPRKAGPAEYEAVGEGPGAPPAEHPWLPYRYLRPLWGSARAHTSPGSGHISRVLWAGTYLSVRGETIHDGERWFLTACGDWIAADDGALLRPTELRGVELDEAAPMAAPPLAPAPPTTPERHGAVTAERLNVRAQPGVRSDNPPVDMVRGGTEVRILEEVTLGGGAVWFRIGYARWIHASHVRLLGKKPVEDATPAPKRGVVTADALNVRSSPGAVSDNPPLDRLASGSHVTIYEITDEEGIPWYRIGPDRWIHGGWVRLIDDASRGSTGPAIDVPSCLPLGWVVSAELNVRSRPGVSEDNPTVDRFVHNRPVPVLEHAAVGGATWYRVGEERWVDGTSLGVARFRQRPAVIRSEERWVGVNLQQQTAVAYEGDRPVYAALVATGRPATPTVQGIFHTWKRMPTTPMSGGNPSRGSYYYLEDVTWTSYFYSGYALHAAYWHDAFGRTRSHGCVNLSPHDAWWLYQWSAIGGAKSPAVYVYWA